MCTCMTKGRIKFRVTTLIYVILANNISKAPNEARQCNGCDRSKGVNLFEYSELIFTYFLSTLSHLTGFSLADMLSYSSLQRLMNH